jgi:hypothetical protein
MVREEGVGEILARHPGDPEGAVRDLLAAALEAGGNDNITVVVIDVKERAEEPRAAGGGATAEDRSRGTAEMPSLGVPPGTPRERTGGAKSPSAGTRQRRARAPGHPKRRSGGAARFLAGLVRGLAVVLVVLVALVPAYLWGSSRYFLAFEEGEVVAYRGLPYAPLGVELNQEWRKPGLTESEIKEPYEQPIETHKLYTKEDAERVLGDMGR